MNQPQPKLNPEAPRTAAKLLSYPRSGSTWVRYIIEQISGRPTSGCPGSGGDPPLERRFKTGRVNLDLEPIIYKYHRFDHAKMQPVGKLLVIVRDYREAILRHALQDNVHNHAKLCEYFFKRTQGWGNYMDDYVGVLLWYDMWRDKKMLVYYEDLITQPKEAIQDIGHFLNVKSVFVDKFIKDLNYHRELSLNKYPDGAKSKGKGIRYHSKQASADLLKFMDNSIAERHPLLTDRYLRRYTELRKPY